MPLARPEGELGRTSAQMAGQADREAGEPTAEFSPPTLIRVWPLCERSERIAPMNLRVTNRVLYSLARKNDGDRPALINYQEQDLQHRVEMFNNLQQRRAR
jgi:hypothetical protein